jgi:hypothetical protein
VLTKTFGITEGLLPPDRRMETFWRVIDLERGLLVGMGGLLVGIPLLIAAVLQWWSVDFGSLDYSRTMRLVIPGFLFTILGVQTILYSFFGSILGLRRR